MIILFNHMFLFLKIALLLYLSYSIHILNSFSVCDYIFFLISMPFHIMIGTFCRQNSPSLLLSYPTLILLLLLSPPPPFI